MKIGIFMGYGPQVILNKEGLGRYIGSLIKGFVSSEHEVIIACHLWQKDSINELLEELQIPKEKIELCMNDTNPPVWNFYKKVFLRKPKRNKIFDYLLNILNIFMGRYIDDLLKINNNLTFYVYLLFGGIIVLFLFPLGVCFGILAFLFYCVYRLLFFCGLKKSKLKLAVRKIISKIHLRLDYPTENLWIDGFDILMHNSLVNLVKTLNKRCNVDVWFIPSLFWPEAQGLKGFKVFCAPDLVSREYALGFRNVLNSEHSIYNCVNTLRNGEYFITYCEYLKNSLLIEQYSKNMNKVIAIPHANNDMAPYIYFDDEALKMKCNASKDFAKEFAHSISELGDIKYIFFASQVRPYKNILGLIKAYEFLLKRQKISLKLVLTGLNSQNVKEREYIKKHNLENEIISCYNVSAKKLAALYKCATLVVNPTLYEGGFPFTFGEGMSVGTPSIMSDIPQVRDVLEPEGLEEIMFDPFDWMAIAKKIEWALLDIDGLYKKELPLYEKMAKRTYSVVANEYVETFKAFAWKEN